MPNTEWVSINSSNETSKIWPTLAIGLCLRRHVMHPPKRVRGATKAHLAARRQPCFGQGDRPGKIFGCRAVPERCAYFLLFVPGAEACRGEVSHVNRRHPWTRRHMRWPLSSNSHSCPRTHATMADVQPPRLRLSQRQRQEAAIKKAFAERQLSEANHAHSVSGSSDGVISTNKTGSTGRATPIRIAVPDRGATSSRRRISNDTATPGDEDAPNDRTPSRLPYPSLPFVLCVLTATLALVGACLLRIGCFASVPLLPTQWMDERQGIYNLSGRLDIGGVEDTQLFSDFKSFADAIPFEEERIGRRVYQDLFPSVMVATSRMRTCQLSEFLPCPVQARMQLKCHRFLTLELALTQTSAHIAPLIKRLEQAPDQTQLLLSQVSSAWHAQLSSSSSLMESVRGMSGTATRVDIKPQIARLDTSIQTSKNLARSLEMAKQLIHRQEINWKTLLEEIGYSRQQVKRWVHDGCAKHPSEEALDAFRVHFCSDLGGLFPGLARHKLCQ
jgi:hypothetical protein